MRLSEIAAIVEEVSEYPLIGVRRHATYVIVDIGRIDGMGHPNPIIPFVVADQHLADAVEGAEYLRILTREACEKVRAFLPALGVHS